MKIRHVAASRTATTTRLPALVLLVAAGTALSACGGAQEAPPAATPSSPVSGRIVIAGSSTVGPLTNNIADRFTAANPDTHITTDITSTGEGFRALCTGSLDVSNASRAIEPAEVQACERAGIKYTQILAANDGITVVVNPANTWARCLSVEALRKMWSPQSQGTVTTWKQVDPSYPDEPLALYGPDMTSGTLDYFTEKINGTEKEIRSDYSGSTDDHKTLEGVHAHEGGVGFLGLSYALDDEDMATRVDVDGGKGCVEATPTTVRDGTYAPLSRPLYIYVNNASFESKPQVKRFIEYYVQWARNVAEDNNFVPVTETQRDDAKRALAELGGDSEGS